MIQEREILKSTVSSLVEFEKSIKDAIKNSSLGFLSSLALVFIAIFVFENPVPMALIGMFFVGGFLRDFLENSLRIKYLKKEREILEEKLRNITGL